jgi:hypothetical protein
VEALPTQLRYFRGTPGGLDIYIATSASGGASWRPSVVARNETADAEALAMLRSHPQVLAIAYEEAPALSAEAPLAADTEAVLPGFPWGLPQPNPFPKNAVLMVHRWFKVWQLMEATLQGSGHRYATLVRLRPDVLLPADNDEVWPQGVNLEDFVEGADTRVWAASSVRSVMPHAEGSSLYSSKLWTAAAAGSAPVHAHVLYVPSVSIKDCTCVDYLAWGPFDSMRLYHRSVLHLQQLMVKEQMPLVGGENVVFGGLMAGARELTAAARLLQPDAPAHIVTFVRHRVKFCVWARPQLAKDPIKACWDTLDYQHT